MKHFDVLFPPEHPLDLPAFVSLVGSLVFLAGGGGREGRGVVVLIITLHFPSFPLLAPYSKMPFHARDRASGHVDYVYCLFAVFFFRIKARRWYKAEQSTATAPLELSRFPVLSLLSGTGRYITAKLVLVRRIVKALVRHHGLHRVQRGMRWVPVLHPSPLPECCLRIPHYESRPKLCSTPFKCDEV